MYRRRLTVCFILAIAVSTASAQTGSSDSLTAQQLLNLFIGKWEGTATALYPREMERPLREEQVEVECRPVLGGTYIECRSTWTTGDGASRELLTFWNYDQAADSVNILFLYDNWPGKVRYALSYDPNKREIVGYDTFTAGGIPAEERVVWSFSGSGDEITGTEFNHYSTDPEGYWPQTFRFVWKKER